LQTQDRNWDSNVHLTHRPVLTSELDIDGQITSDKSRSNNTVHLPSGFLRKGALKYSDNIDSLFSSAVSGEILTSKELTNSFYLASDGETNTAMVNGWPINVSATGTPTGDNHNLILMGDYSSTFTEFVFLEVWRELVSYQDTIRKYGNQTAYASVTNDLYNEGIGFETSRRVQIKYRVRVEKGYSIDLNANPDGFNTSVFARGGAASASTKNFVNMGSAGDPGLYRAGNGSSSDQTTLGTVDGYVYAIPMFLVSRRVRSTSPITSFDPTDPMAMYNAGKKSDGNAFRPDNLYADVIYPQDIIDLRRQVAISAINPRMLAERTIKSVAKGSYRETKGKLSLASGGYGEAPGGSNLITADKLDSDSLVSTMGLIKSGVPRRSFCNTEVPQDNNVRKIPVSAWVAGSFTLSLSGYPISGQSIAEPFLDDAFVYSVSGWKEEGVDYTITSTYNGTYHSIVVTSLVGTPSEDWYLKYDLGISANGSYGFRDIPSKVLEQRIDTIINAEYGNPVELYNRSSFYSYGDQIRLLGTGDQDIVNFGQVAFIEATVESPNSVYLDLPGMVLPQTGQAVLGVRSVRRKDSTGTLGDYKTINFTRLDQNLLTIGVAAALPGETSTVEVSLYLGTKSFETNKEGKGVVNTVEATFLDVSIVSGTKYTFSSDSVAVGYDMKAIKGMCSFLEGSVDKPTYTPYFLRKESGYTYFESIPATALRTNRANLPMYTVPVFPDAENNPTTVTWTQGGVALTGEMKIGAFLDSWADSTDGLIQFVYNTRGYQGMLLDTGKQMEVLCEGPALISSNGSGSAQDTILNVLAATVGSDMTVKIYESDVGRLLNKGQIQEGDFFKLSASDTARYRVSAVTTGSDGLGSYTLVSLYDNLISAGSQGLHDDVVFVRPDTSADMFTNVVGRMPSAASDDYLYAGDALVSGLSTTYASPISSAADAMASDTNGVTVGAGSVSLRGIQDMVAEVVDGLEYTSEGAAKIQTMYEAVLDGVAYKVFQSYVVKERPTGKVYLAVVASDTTSMESIPSTDPFQGKDVVDLFELNGRTLFKAST